MIFNRPQHFNSAAWAALTAEQQVIFKRKGAHLRKKSAKQNKVAKIWFDGRYWLSPKQITLLSPGQKAICLATGLVATNRQTTLANRRRLKFLDGDDFEYFGQHRQWSEKAKKKMILAGATPAPRRPFIPTKKWRTLTKKDKEYFFAHNRLSKEAAERPLRPFWYSKSIWKKLDKKQKKAYLKALSRRALEKKKWVPSDKWAKIPYKIKKLFFYTRSKKKALSKLKKKKALKKKIKKMVTAPRMRSVFRLKRFIKAYTEENPIKSKRVIKHKHIRVEKEAVAEYFDRPLLTKKLQYYYRRLYEEYAIKPAKPLKEVTKPIIKSKKSAKKKKKKIPLSSMVALNKDYFRFADGVYTSYWLGRFTNMFIKDGAKKTATKHLQKALVQLKFTFHEMPILIVLELLERLKPTFRLRKYIVRRTIIKDYPFVAKESRRYMVAVHWVKAEIKTEYKSSSIEPFSSRVYAKISSFKSNPRKHSLIKTRDKNEAYAVDSQFNIRYKWR